MRISEKVEKLQPSGIRAFFDLVLGMPEVISLGVGEPDFPTPWKIREAGIYALEKGSTTYTSNKGLYKLRLCIARYLRNKFGLRYNPDEEILITVGVSQGVDLAFRAILNQGDEVLVPTPAYVAYSPAVELAYGKAVEIKLDCKNGFKLTPDLLRRHISRSTKAVILNYPVNPTGASYTKTELARLNAVIQKRGLLTVTDEVYGDLTYDFEHTAFATLKGAKANTVYLNGFSKAYSMTGWRVGFACGPRDLIAAMTKIHQYTMLCAPTVSQFAAAEALEGGDVSIEEMRREYRRRREVVVEGFNSMGLPCARPQGAFYVFPSVRRFGLPALEFAKRLLEKEKVAVVPGSAFGSGLEGFVRVSYATNMDKLKEALLRIKRFLKGLRAKKHF